MSITLPWFMAFDHVPTISNGDRATGPDGGMSVWNMNNIDVADGRRWADGGTNNYMERTVPAGTEFVVGIRVQRTSTGTGSDSLIDFLDSGGSSMFRLFVNGSSGKLEARRGTTVLATSDLVLADGGEYYIEFHAKIDDAVGAYELRVNGITEFSGSGVDTNDTASTNCENIRFNGLFGTGFGGVGVHYTDLYIRSGSTFYGPLFLEILNPDSDVTKGWTPSSGTDHFALVDEEVSNEDTDYVETSVAATDDLYGLGDLAASYANIIAVVAVTVGRNTDAGSNTIKHVLDDGVNEDPGADVALSAGNFETQATAFTLAPDGGAWSAADVDGLRIGIRSS